MIWSFLTKYRLIVITIILVVVNLINSILSSPIPYIDVAILLVIVLILVFLSWWVEQISILIKQYGLLMNILEKLKGTLILELLERPPKHLEYSSYWKDYFELKQREVDRKFNELNSKLYEWKGEKLCRLLFVDIDWIEREFIKVLRDINTLNEDFKEQILYENIPEYKLGWIDIEKIYKNLCTILNRSEFIEINNTVKDLVVFSQISESTWDLIDNHNSDLVKTAQAWQVLLPLEIPITEMLTDREQYDQFNISFIEKIEALPFFEDVFYHAQSLEPLWNNFKSISNNYRSDKRRLYGLIREYICQQLKTQAINGLGVDRGFCVSVYIDLIIEARGNVNEYKYFTDDAGNRLYWVYYCKSFPNGSRLDGTCQQIARTDDLEKLERLRANMVKECKTQYISKGKKLIETEAKLREVKDALNEALKNVRLTQMDCDVIKRGNVNGT
jgi:hypothetical protein